MRIGDIIWENGRNRCGICNGDICDAEENWKENALVKRGRADRMLNSGKFGTEFKVYENENLEIAEIFCPNCHALLSVELYLVGEPLRWTYRSLDGSANAGYDARSEYLRNPDEWISFGAAK